MPQEPRSCTHCGARLGSGGRPSRSGVHYCSKRECQNARAKSAYRAKNGYLTERQAPTKCFHCGADLPPRAARPTDSPIGRWCHQSACRRHKAAMLEKGTVRNADEYQAEIAALEAIITILATAYNVPRVTCPVCGIVDAVDGYPHRDNFGEKCIGTGEKPMKIPAAQIIWPEKFGPHPAMLALAAEQMAAQSRPQEVHPE